MDGFHNFNCCLIFGVIFFVFFLGVYQVFSFFFFKLDGVEYQLGELVCSVFPIFVLFLQMFPSLYLLYFLGLMDSCTDLSVKVVGHQWYWSYFYRDFDNLEFDSYFKTLDVLQEGELRLLDVDNRCVLPINTNICFCITSSDVIHSWAIFNMSIKLDAMRGILSTFFFSFPVVGLYFGQCSEICGANHSFMPIVLEVTLFSFFKNWCLFF